MTIFSNSTWSPLATAGRYILASAGSVVATLAAVGILSQGDAATATEAIKNIAASLGTIATSLTALAGIAMSLYAGVRGSLNSTQVAAVATVAAMKDDPESPVKGVIVDQSIAGSALTREVLNANPDAGIAPAGTAVAAKLAAHT